MTRSLIAGAAVAASIIAAGPASAQATGAAAPGGANAAQATSNNREQNAGYNRVVGAMDPVTAKTDDAPVRKGKARAAAAGEVVAGSMVRDRDGKMVGTVEAVDADGAVVATGQAKVEVPLIAFGKDDVGLLLAITAARFNELVAKAQTSAR